VTDQRLIMTKQQFDAVVDDAIREGKQLAFKATADWLRQNEPGLTVELSTGLYINVEDLRLYLTEAPTWPENAR
jgi:hypothetical protein